MSRGDPVRSEAILEHLDQHVESVRRLAQSLVVDPNVADDLAQDAWVAALTSPPPADRPVRAWLGRVVRNAARSLGRREAIRAGHERDAAAGDGLPTTHEMLDRVSMQRSVVESVLALEEPYRRAILLRYFEGLTPNEIARKQGVPVATVKTQLRRALAHMRERLDRDHGDRRAWLLALMPLAKPGGTVAAAATGALIVSTKTAVGTVAAMAAILVGGVWWTNRAMKPEAPEVAAATPEVTGTEPIAPLVDPQVEAVSGTAMREEAESSTPGAVVAITLEVVEAASGDPLSGVEVWYGPGSDYMGLLRARLTMGNPDPEQVLREKGEMRVSDASGRVTIPKDTEYGWVLAVARRDQLFGMNQVVFANEATHRLELAPDNSITIEVVDQEGNPASGVPVGVRMGENRREELLWSARTGEDGTAVMRHFESFAGEYVAQGHTPYALLAFPLATPVEVELQPEALPQHLRLVVPSTGRTVVFLEDEKGERLVDEGGRWASLTSYIEDPLESEGLRRVGRHDVYTYDGVATFPHVEIGLELRAWMASGLEGHKPVEVRGPGPRAAGEEVEFVLRFGDLYPILVGRLVDEAGEPVPDRRGRIRFVWQNAEGEDQEKYENLRSDDGGHFRVTFRTEVMPPVGSEVHIKTEPEPGRPGLGAMIRLDSPLGAGEVLLGDVSLSGSQLPVVVSGQVVDTQGEPIYWATIDVAKKRYYHEDSFVWDWVGGLRTETARDGSFEIQGRLDPGEYALQVMANGYVTTEKLPLAPGVRGLRIALTGEGALEGTLLLGEHIPAAWMAVEVRPVERPDEVRKDQPRPSGGFRVQDLRPGPSDVFVRLGWDPEPLRTVRDVLIREGGVTRDERLDDLDLGDLVHRIGIEVVDSLGKPVDMGYVAFGPADGTAATQRVALDHGNAVILARWPTLDLEVVAPGYRTQRLPGVHGDRRVVMPAGIPIRVRLPDGFELPVKPLTLSVGLIKETQDDVWQERIQVPDRSGFVSIGNWEHRTFEVIDMGEGARFRLPDPGAFRVSWKLEQAGEDGDSGTSRGVSSKTYEIEVEDVRDEIVFELAPSAESYAKTLAAFPSED